MRGEDGTAIDPLGEGCLSKKNCAQEGFFAGRGLRRKAWRINPNNIQFKWRFTEGESLVNKGKVLEHPNQTPPKSKSQKMGEC